MGKQAFNVLKLGVQICTQLREQFGKSLKILNARAICHRNSFSSSPPICCTCPMMQSYTYIQQRSL